MERGENAIEMRFAQAFSFDFDGVETSLVGWAASLFRETRIYSRRDQVKAFLGPNLTKKESYGRGKLFYNISRSR
ncbi:MAG: hypothetical protein K6A76_01840 [Oribacterium sp.]|nr:hypothetical protein [Oribacterium sp.]